MNTRRFFSGLWRVLFPLSPEISVDRAPLPLNRNGDQINNVGQKMVLQPNELWDYNPRNNWIAIQGEKILCPTRNDKSKNYLPGLWKRALWFI
jgi:hypothetical protein